MKEKNIKTYGFKTEIKQLLNIMIHSLYSNKEIFLRELISNSSDAIDKLRFNSISNPNLYKKIDKPLIKISIDDKKKILKIEDNGIGMTKEEVINNLGTIAKSGTKEFIESLNKKENKKNNMIGKFGVGFYSSFMVANKVSVYTKSALNEQEAIFWVSKGEGEYSIETTKKKNNGTEINLYLRPEELHFLNYNVIENIINKYSNHISIPIKMEIKDKKNKKKEWKKINKAKALWIINKNNISKENYIDFYKNKFNEIDEPLIWSHNFVEGKFEYINLIYIPSTLPRQIWNKDYKGELKLYVQRVFIMEDVKQFLPYYLRFIKGIIDSNDLPLNVSREILQNNNIIKNIRLSLTKRIINMIKKLSKDENKFKIFWNKFGLILKEGVVEDLINKKDIINLLRFSSSFNKDDSTKIISLKDYVSRMKTNQDKIYFITADNFKSAKNSPHLELFYKEKIEVLLLFDRIDEWVINNIIEFEGKKFQSISISDDSLEKLINKSKKIDKNEKNYFLNFLNRIKIILKNKVKDIKINYNIVDTNPVMIKTDINDISTQMSKLLKSVGQKSPKIKYILEINPNNKLIQKICKIKDDKIFKNWIEFLLNQALLIEQGYLNNPNKFIKIINKLLLIK
ncbi:Chaperone protein HtpG [Candidatus Annandia adelgestsuga]|uniref:Chaperone protein HtpG n=1 Tax=Candidatus Annandia adelgestsuga TaxID=1302411 RepID=A0A3Q9CPF3_9ENTR|nr:molecular chaperone HtpG [Candidatus Annandia adelgestsuga]AZP36364.1 Chaperone protein HtpG [Candidatus Annandia adelgestsuga]